MDPDSRSPCPPHLLGLPSVLHMITVTPAKAHMHTRLITSCSDRGMDYCNTGKAHTHMSLITSCSDRGTDYCNKGTHAHEADNIMF